MSELGMPSGIGPATTLEFKQAALCELTPSCQGFRCGGCLFHTSNSDLSEEQIALIDARVIEVLQDE